jgi:hypothetical protein
MADKIVSWGGIDSKSTAGMGVTGSLSLTGDLNFQPGATRYISMSASPTTASGNSIVIQAGDAIASGTGGSISIQPGGGAGGPGAGTVTISNTTWWNGATVNGLLTVTNQGPNTGTALTVNAGAQIAMRFDWDNINLVTSAVSANRILRFTGASQYQVRGSGTTSSTTAFRVQNANASSSLSVRDDGEVTVGGSIGLPVSSYVYWGDINSAIQHTGAATNFRTYQDNQPWSFITANNSSVQAKIDTGYVRVKTGFSAVGNSPITMSGWDGGGGTAGNVLLVKGGNSGVGTSYTGGNGSDLVLENGLATDNSLGFGGTPGSIIFKYGTYNNTASVEYGRLNSSGNFLIGTTAGSAKLLISGSSNSVLFEIDSPAQQNILYVSGSGRIGIGKSTEYALEIANTSSLRESAYTNIPFGYATGSAAVSITPNIYATTGQRSFYSLYIGNPTITISGSFGNYDYRGLYVAGGSTLNGGIIAGDSRFFATSNAVSFQGYNPFNGQTGDVAGGITFTSRQVAGGDEAGIGAYYGGGSRLYIYNKYNASDSKVIFSLGGTIRSTYFGTGNLSIGNGETDMSARLGVKGSGTTSSTTALLVQNANATSSLQIYDNGNITIGLGTTTFSSIGSNGSAPSSSIYFDNNPNNHQIHHQIITRASGQGSPYNYLRFPAAYDGVYQFIGAGGGVTLALSNSGSTAFMNYNHNGITTNSSNTPITIDPSARTLTYGGGSNDVNHLVPYSIILKGNRPLSSGLDAGGDVYILGGLPRSGSSGASGSIYLLGGTINISGSVVITGSLTVSGSITATVPTTSSYVCDGILSSNQTFATGSDQIIAFVDYVDPNGWLTSNQFKPTIAGYYSVSFGAWLQNPGVASNQVNVQMRKNGNSMIISQQPLNNGTGISLGGSRIIQMNGTTDYLDWTVFQGTVGSGTTGTLLQGSANGQGTWFSAFLLTQ